MSEICKCCTQRIPVKRGKTARELENDLHKELFIKPDGYTVLDKKPYWYSHNKKGTIRLIEAVKKLKEKLK